MFSRVVAWSWVLKRTGCVVVIARYACHRVIGIQTSAMGFLTCSR